MTASPKPKTGVIYATQRTGVVSPITGRTICPWPETSLLEPLYPWRPMAGCHGRLARRPDRRKRDHQTQSHQHCPTAESRNRCANGERELWLCPRGASHVGIRGHVLVPFQLVPPIWGGRMHYTYVLRSDADKCRPNYFFLKRQCAPGKRRLNRSEQSGRQGKLGRYKLERY